MANEVKEWREKLGITQNEAAEQLGVTARNYQAYEAGDYSPPIAVRKLMTAVASGVYLHPWPMADRKQRGKK
jgi:DNA-binding XRE family transcriptional regulator